LEILIKNGFVFDPTNNIDGDVMDIHIRDGKIVQEVSESAKVIDAKGKIVMPGGVDIHTHIAGAKINAARLFRPEDHYRRVVPKTKLTHSGVGYSTPTSYITGYRYARLGYTTVIEAASPPLETRHTHEELNDLPMLDKATYIVLGNNWTILDYLSEGDLEKAAAYVSWVLKAVKGYGIKIVNPGGVELWGWGRNVDSIDDTVEPFNLTPREILRGLAKINTMLDLPHTIHVHSNNLGKPGNAYTTYQTMDAVSDLAGSNPNIHITHIQFTGYAGDDWLSLRSGAEKLSKYINMHKHVTFDLGQVIFGDTTTMTADGPFQYILYNLTHNKWTGGEVEAEASSGIVPYSYKKKNYVNSIQWAIGLEMALMVKDPWRTFMTTDHPNGGNFLEYPRVITWLMSTLARERSLKKINKRARKRLALPTLDREYSFYEIAIITRAATAKALSMKNKGHLGIGADADVAIYDINPETINQTNDYLKIRKALRHAAYTIKGGEIVVKDGEIVQVVDGETYWVDSKIRDELMQSVIPELKEKFKQYYTVSFNNFPIAEKELLHSRRIQRKGKI